MTSSVREFEAKINFEALCIEFNKDGKPYFDKDSKLAFDKKGNRFCVVKKSDELPKDWEGSLHVVTAKVQLVLKTVDFTRLSLKEAFQMDSILSHLEFEINKNNSYAELPYCCLPFACCCLVQIPPLEESAIQRFQQEAGMTIPEVFNESEDEMQAFAKNASKLLEHFDATPNAVERKPAFVAKLLGNCLISAKFLSEDQGSLDRWLLVANKLLTLEGHQYGRKGDLEYELQVCQNPTFFKVCAVRISSNDKMSDNVAKIAFALFNRRSKLLSPRRSIQFGLDALLLTGLANLATRLKSPASLETLFKEDPFCIGVFSSLSKHLLGGDANVTRNLLNAVMQPLTLSEESSEKSADNKDDSKANEQQTFIEFMARRYLKSFPEEIGNLEMFCAVLGNVLTALDTYPQLPKVLKGLFFNDDRLMGDAYVYMLSYPENAIDEVLALLKLKFEKTSAAALD